MKALEKIQEISRRLYPCGFEAVEKEAEFLVTHGLDINPVDLYRDNPELNAAQTAVIDEMVMRRSNREPLQYILGYNDFLALRLLVGYGVLIPRPETELMAEHAIRQVRSQKSEVRSKRTKQGRKTPSCSRRMTILDLCTGSGCLALAIAKEFQDAQVYGVDISDSALSYARMNARINGIENVSYIKGNLLDPLGRSDLFDLIISNPPYIRSDEMRTLQPEIKEWEPLNALDGGSDGLDYYREIIPASRKYLKEGGMLMLEMGEGGAEEIARMLKDEGYVEIEIRKDCSGIQRIIQAQWTK